jgi:Arc/MetJ-type ribon-helix-helix transcriptional regulator
MKKAISVKRKKRGRPATGTEPLYGVRISDELMTHIQKWAQENGATRSEAIRRLVELGLDTAKPPAQTTAKTADKAKELAGDAINQMADESASADEQASRKRKLISGPEEFRDARVDRPKKK